jgi:NtrC-family two-component system sensor histidine kinase KinB
LGQEQQTQEADLVAWTLRKKILIGYGVVLILMSVIIGWSLANLVRLGRASNAILEENYRSILAAENMVNAIERQDSAMLLLMLGRAPEGLTQFRSNENLFLQWLARAKDNITVPGEDRIVTTIEEGYSTYLVRFSELRLRARTDANDAETFYRQSILPVFQQVRDESVHLRQINQRTMFTASSRAARLAARAVWSVAALGGAALGLSLVFSLLLSHVIVQPLQQIMGATQKLAEGDYDARVALHSSDELGNLAFDFNAMAERLKDYKELDVRQIVSEKQKSEAILRSIDDGIVVLDADDLRVREVNPTAGRIFGISPEQARGRHVLEIVKDEGVFEQIKRAAGPPTTPAAPEEQRVLTLARDQTEYHYQFSLTAVRPPGEPAASIVLLLRDITRLKELDRLKSEFVMAASHELRTPLTSMEMSVELLQERVASRLGEKEQQLLAAAREEILRLKALVNDLLDISRIEAGRMQMDFERVAVQRLLDQAVGVLGNQAEEKGVALSGAAEPGLPLVRADVNKITWVLTNLISNALRYTAAGGYIRLHAERVGPQVHISVADNGQGIPYEYQSRIFDKFVQVQGAGPAGGTGLGLAISREIVRAHGGTIWVDSHPGQGSTFTFTLPAVE